MAGKLGDALYRKEIGAYFRSLHGILNHLQVLARHEIAARNSAVIPDLMISKSLRDSTVRSNPRDWYDYNVASDEELAFFIESMERDIVEIASLYLRLADCGSVLRFKSH